MTATFKIKKPPTLQTLHVLQFSQLVSLQNSGPLLLDGDVQLLATQQEPEGGQQEVKKDRGGKHLNGSDGETCLSDT